MMVPLERRLLQCERRSAHKPCEGMQGGGSTFSTTSTSGSISSSSPRKIGCLRVAHERTLA